ncbi:hypothetical protein BDY17DRAFT_100362 [Neohortaea acidophila]|uniref:C3H1-type domain-containing protein n=1 Tax=Neohortaea acidophila TaxID=245834 RepID=A0A6A6PZX2_9PEZI|nr:uncharacterized protein BDY17DRAFT_100362 [Neohortaea acidophila]KAF2485294.1 hypothetical protein BDY17DRAFT_100362 [Neohortaea acidophila]
MDQLPRSKEGYANNNLFADSQQQFNAYDNLFQSGPGQSPYDASWGLNAGNYPSQSRVQHSSTPSWPQNTNHLSLPPAQGNLHAHAAPYHRPLAPSPAPYGGQNAVDTYQTPHTYQYAPQYDPSLLPQHAFNQNFNYSTADRHTPNAATVAPHALQQEKSSSAFAHNPYGAPSYQVNSVAQSRPLNPSTPDVADQRQLMASIPQGTNAGQFSIIRFDDLANATRSQRMGNFVNVGVDALNWDLNRAALPPYVPRKSRNELRRLAANDPKLLAKLSKTGVKKQRLLAAAAKPSLAVGKTSSPTGEKIKYEGDSPSEDEDSSSDDDDESSYTSDEAAETSPLPAKRPDTPKGATEYDTIKALWRGKRRSLASDSIRKGLGEFWEIVKTIRDRWKADVAALQDAESKNRTNELPLLQSRVKDQRDMLETAFKAALKHGHRDIILLMSENVSLLFLCYQFLLDRAKVEDYNSALPRTILETVALFTTITQTKLENTHMVKVLPRYAKRGDAKTQFYAKRIIASAAEASAEKSAEPGSAKDKVAGSPPSKKSEPEPVAGVKRPSSAANDGGAQKKVAIASSKSNGLSTATKLGTTAKKSTLANDNTKAATTAAAVPAVKPKQVVAKPSGLFASLQSAGKKPGTSTANRAAQASTTGVAGRTIDKTSNASSTTGPSAAPAPSFSFAETMANLSKPKEEKPAPKVERQVPDETPEEKRKRLRKESRRHLHVTFKTGEDLVQIREFHHDPDEELGHDANQVRDVSDVGGEGRMFKQQHSMMDIDEEDEAADDGAGLVDFTPPKDIDFTVVDAEERKRNSIKFGGEVEPESAERAARDAHEANTLIVFYTDPKDIPPNPREPSDPYSGEQSDKIKQFGLPDAKWDARAKGKSVAMQQMPTAQQQQTANVAPQFDFANIGNLMITPQSGYQPSMPTVSQPSLPGGDAISNILASLKQAQANQGTPPASAMGAFNLPSSAPPPTFAPAPQPSTIPAGQPDLAAILAQIQQNQGGAAQPPAMSGFGLNTPGPMPGMTSYQPQAQQQQQQQQQQTSVYENQERKQWREGSANDNATKAKRQTTAQSPWFRTKVCKYWQEGRCQKGDQCTYKHEEE